MGEGTGKGKEISQEAARSLLLRDTGLLNTLTAYLKENMLPEHLADINLALPRIKLAMMKSVWGPDWGDYPAFEEWVLRGAQGPPPPGLEKPASFYRFRQETGQK